MSAMVLRFRKTAGPLTTKPRHSRNSIPYETVRAVSFVVPNRECRPASKTPIHV